MGFFEALMLIAFGVGWPVSIWRTLTAPSVAGKSLLFLGIIFTGYVCGLTHKLLNSRDWVIVFYVINALLVATDFVMVVRRRHRELAD